MCVDPGQTLRMGQNRHIAGYDQIEKRVDQSCRVNMMRGFDQNVAATGKSQKPSVPESRYQIRNKMHVRTADKIQGYAFAQEDLLKFRDCTLYHVAAVVVQSGSDVRRAGHIGRALLNGHFGHGNCNGSVGGTVINSREDMVV